MPREFSRASRVAMQIQRELADLLAREVSDPRLHRATISRVEVTADLGRARVYLTANSPQQVEQILKAAEKAAGFLRRGLAQRIRTRVLPRLEFMQDAELERAYRLSSLIDSATAFERGGMPARGGPDDGEGP